MPLVQDLLKLLGTVVGGGGGGSGKQLKQQVLTCSNMSIECELSAIVPISHHFLTKDVSFCLLTSSLQSYCSASCFNLLANL